MLAFNQFRRIFNDDGRNDKHFNREEMILRKSLVKLKNATDDLIRASNRLYDILKRSEGDNLH